MSEFVGTSRRESVADLSTMFRDVEAGHGPRMIVLSAPSGEGKTRIVQEFYRDLAASQAEPRYWPAELAPDDSDWKTGRKLLRLPPFRPDADAEMPWLYWSVGCSRRQDGSRTNALTNDADQFGVHADYLFGRVDATDRGYDGVSAVVGMLSILNVVFPPLMAGVVVVDATKYVIQNRDFIQKFWQWKKNRKETKEGTRVVDAASHKKVDEAEELAHFVTKISRRMPVIIAVDDAHWADEFTLHFLQKVLEEQRARVLIIATAWPDGPLDDVADDGLDAQSVNLFSTWLRGMDGAALNDRIGVRGLEPLETDELISLAHSIYGDIANEGDPPLGSDIAAALAKRLSTPMAVRAFFDLNMVKDQIHHGGLELRDLVNLPQTMSDIMIAFWAELPDNVCQVLSIAAVSGEQFPVQQVLLAAEELEYSGAERSLDQSKSHYGVTRDVIDSLEAFTDVLLHQRARAAGEFSSRQLEIIYDTIAAYAVSLDLEATPVALASSAWSAHVAITENDRDGFVDRNLASTSAWNLAEQSGRSYSFVEALRYARLSMEWSSLPEDDPAILEIRRTVAHWSAQVGQVSQAVQMLRAVLDDQIRVLSADDRDILDTRFYLALWIGESGQYANAIEMLRENLIEEARVLAADDPHILLTRSELAHRLAQVGQVVEAIEMFELVLDEETKRLSPNAVATLITRFRLIECIRETGDFARSIEMARILIDDSIRVLGPNDPETLTIQLGLARSLGQSGQVDEAITMLRALLDNGIGFLGPHSSSVLSMRNDLAKWIFADGQYAEAIEMFRAVVDDRVRLFGKDNPNTLISRKNLALALEEVGDVTTAIEMLRTLLDDEARVFGPNFLSTIFTKQRLAELLCTDDQDEEALALYQSLLEDQILVLGPDDAGSFETRQAIALLTADAGHVAEAIELLRTLVDDETSALGDDAHATLTSRSALALLTGMNGDVETALEMYRVLVEDQSRHMDADDGILMKTRADFEELQASL